MTDTIVVRGVAAMPSRIARVVYVRREKDALEQFLTDKLAFYLLFISNWLGVEKILDGFAEVAASPLAKRLRRQVRASLKPYTSQNGACIIR
jgi:hypothetical protein